MLNLHSLFFSGDNPDAFDRAISPSEEQRKELVRAKNKIRDHLREGIRRASTTVLGMEKQVEPKFRTQGSWSYKTCIQGAQVPPQEMDWDFGVYLPVTVWDVSAPPHAMAKLYFAFVEESLEGLCRREGWELPKRNPRCVRVKIASWAHIDLPLYAAPEEKFEKVKESVVLDHALSKNYLRESVSASLEEHSELGEMPEDFWAEMEDIHMAKRNGEWVKSDPEQVSKWFNDRVSQHGDQLRRVCRYLKAWRDYHWEEGGPTSVLLMIMAAKQFERARGRDDVALERAAQAVEVLVRGEVREAGIDLCEEDFNRLDDAGRQLASERAGQLRSAIRRARALQVAMRGEAVLRIQEQLGERIPYDPDLVVADGAGEVRSAEARVVVPPVVGATHAG
ncbi:CBASS cGAMP synthase [Stenotrophomonas sp.]|uniref:CBASS cGAMP synthase n=1 Tax=Stenotrophomonas sp. TaxID=69392 RepID=UPI0028AC7EC7|nr:CBASS cGAMP synthase [Stenotrophomonas sp.]